MIIIFLFLVTNLIFKKNMESYYTHQAILIGSDTDARRVKNYLRDTLNYECHLLEDPTRNEVTSTIE